MGHAIDERVFLFGTRSADYIRASGHIGCVAMEASLQAKKQGKTGIHGPHPNASQKVRFPLHRGRRPYMTNHSVISRPSIAALRKVYSITSSAATNRASEHL